jgi:hypothetical protein
MQSKITLRFPSEWTYHPYYTRIHSGSETNSYIGFWILLCHFVAWYSRRTNRRHMLAQFGVAKKYLEIQAVKTAHFLMGCHIRPHFWSTYTKNQRSESSWDKFLFPRTAEINLGNRSCNFREDQILIPYQECVEITVLVDHHDFSFC